MDEVVLQKINKLETHDRLLEYKKQTDNIGNEVQKCIDNLPDGIHWPFYVWGHSKQIGMDERWGLFMTNQYEKFEDVPCERIIWIARPEKPEATPNSYLFRANQGTDVVEIIWMIPKYELWDQFAPGKMTYNSDVWISICNFRYNKLDLEKPEPGDMTSEERDQFREIIKRAAWWKKKENSYKMI